MSELVISIFPEELKAEEVRLDLMKRQHEHVVDLEDAVVLVRSKEGKVKLHHVSHLTLSGAMTGGFLGTLMGVMLLNPVFALFGLAAGSMIGAVSGSMSHAGIHEHFMKDLAEQLQPGTSALCILVREQLDRVMEEIGRYHGKVFHTPLLHTDEEQLKVVLESMK